MVVTQQYLIGELSLLLSNVAAVATTDANVEEALRLRRRAETSAPERPARPSRCLLYA